MAHVESGSGGRKTSFEPNLVPVIDLMSVLITFLLITAVWTQVSMIQIGSSLYGKKSEGQPTPPIPPDAQIVLKLEIRPNGYALTVNKKTINFPLVGGVFDDENLMNQLKQVKEQYPQKNDAVIMMADELPYERLIVGMDTLLKGGFGAISIATGGPN